MGLSPSISWARNVLIRRPGLIPARRYFPPPSQPVWPRTGYQRPNLSLPQLQLPIDGRRGRGCAPAVRMPDGPRDSTTAMAMEVVSPSVASWFRCCWGRGCPPRLSSAMSMGRCPWSPACSLGEVVPGDGIGPRPPLRESGPVVTPGRHAVISCIGVHPLVGCARHRASVAGPSTPRCGARSGSRPAPSDRGVS